MVPAMADSPLVYSKTVIKIVPAGSNSKILQKNEPGKKAGNDSKKAEDTKMGDLMPEVRRTSKEFSVAVRPLSFLNQRDFIAIQPFTDREGMMMLVQDNEEARIESSNLLGKIDILFVSKDGIIEQIAPDIALAELSEPLSSSHPVKAFILLKAGMTSASDIKPGDRVENPVFKTHPVILE